MTTRSPQPIGGRYTPESELGRGGMGVVQLAHDTWLDRELAVKTLFENADDGARARFIEEAQVTGQLAHPNIVSIHELGLDERGGDLFMSMKLVRGQDLKQILDAIAKGNPKARRRYPLRKLLRLFLKVCDAVAFAHEAGVLHRDLKPANIMFGKGDEVQVMDWGLALPLEHSSGPESATARKRSRRAVVSRVREGSLEGSAELTEAGAVVGTIAYMPPEQADDAHNVDERADVYALGSILYHMVTLQPPYRGGRIQALTELFKGPPPTPSELLEEGVVPAALEAIILTAMGREPEERYGTVAELSAELEAFLDGRAVKAYKETPIELARRLIRRHRRWLLTAAIALFITTLGLTIADSVTRGRRNEARRSELTARCEREDAALTATRAAALAELSALAAASVEPVAAAVEARRRLRSPSDLESIMALYERAAERLGADLKRLDEKADEVERARRAGARQTPREALRRELEELELDDDDAAELTERLSELDRQASEVESDITRELAALRGRLTAAAGGLDDSLAAVLVARSPRRALEFLDRATLPPARRRLLKVRALLRLRRHRDARELMSAAPEARAGDTEARAALALLETLTRRPPRPSTERLAAIDAFLEQRSAPAWLLARRAELLARLGRLREAMRTARTAAIADPLDARVQFTALRLGLPISASPVLVAARCQTILELAPDFHEVEAFRLTQGLWDRYGTGEWKSYAKALRVLAASRRIDARTKAYYHCTGAFRRGRDAEVLEVAAEGLRRHPDDAALHGSLALAEVRTGEYTDGEAHARRGLELDPEEPRCHRALGELYASRRQYGEARPHLEMAARGSLDSSVWLALARCLAALGRPDDLRAAVQAARRGLAVDPTTRGSTVHPEARPVPGDPELHLALVQIRKKQGKSTLAALHQRRAALLVERLPGLELEARKQRLGELMLGLAELYTESGLGALAVGVYEAIIKRGGSAAEQARARLAELEKGG